MHSLHAMLRTQAALFVHRFPGLTIADLSVLIGAGLDTNPNGSISIPDQTMEILCELENEEIIETRLVDDVRLYPLGYNAAVKVCRSPSFKIERDRCGKCGVGTIEYRDRYCQSCWDEFQRGEWVSAIALMGKDLYS